MTSTRIPWQDKLQQLDDPTSSLHRISLIAIILLGLLLRWILLHEGHAFNVDTIRDETLALKYALGLLAGDPKTWYLAQPALNHGHLPGPLWTLLVAAFYKLGGNTAEGALFWMMLLNTLAIYPLYLFASRLMSRRAALFTALLFAIAPWPIYDSAGLYNPMALPLPTVLLFWSLWQCLNVGRSPAIFWVMLLTAMIMQFHMIAIFYYPAILLLLWLAPVALNRRWLIAGMIAGVAIYLPYLIGDGLHDWANLRAVLSGDNQFNWGLLKILTVPPEMLSNHPGGWPGDSMADLKAFGDRYFGSYWLLLAINLVSFGLAMKFVYGLVRHFIRVLRQARFNPKTALREHRLTVFLGLLLVLPLLLFTLLGKDYASRYSIIIFPLLFLLPVLSLQRMTRLRTQRLVVYVLALMGIVNIYLVVAFALDQQRKLVTAPHYMPAFYKLATLYHALRQDAGPERSIVVNTKSFLASKDHYNIVASEAIHRYVSAYESYGLPTKGKRTEKKYILVTKPSQVPDGKRIVFRDKGLVVYTP